MVMKIALPQGPSFNLHLFHYFVFVFVSIREQIRNTRDGDEDSSASRALIQPQSFPLKVIPEREKACRNKILAFSTFFWQHSSFNLKRNKILAFSRFPFQRKLNSSFSIFFLASSQFQFTESTIQNESSLHHWVWHNVAITRNLNFRLLRFFSF